MDKQVFMTRFNFSLILLLFSIIGSAQESRNVLFLGNSYTYVNNLPTTLVALAASAGDQLSVDMSAPGGYTLQGHSTNSVSLDKIKLGGWDYVVLQEQSQLPSFPDFQVESQVFPYAQDLDSVINEYNECGETMFFMTWGRKNGDASNCANWPPVCTYEGMDSLLYLRYMMMAEMNNAVVSPVGAVWRKIRTDFPGMELYSSDESHPSATGTYAAACCFYSAIFQKDPTLITDDYGITAQDAAAIRQITKEIVFDSLSNWFIGTYNPVAAFDVEVPGSLEAHFTNLSQNASTWMWDFGDGYTSSEENPVHFYDTAGTYLITLIARHCESFDTLQQSVEVNGVGIESTEESAIIVFPNPFINDFQIQLIAPYKLIVYSAIGEVIVNEIVTENIYSVNLGGYPAGLYSIQMQSGSQTIHNKIIKIIP